MGARQYDPVTGRFLEVDPVEGGTPNDYVYPTDPANQSDLNGRWIAGLCVGGFGIAIGGLALNGCILRNMTSGRFAISGSFGIAGGAGGAVSISGLYSDATDLRDMRGKAQCVGASVPVGKGLGGDVCWSSARNGKRVITVLGSLAGLGAGGYFAVTRTGLTILERDGYVTGLVRRFWSYLLAQSRRHRRS